MINVKVDEANRILILEMTGMVSESEIDAVADTLAREYPGVSVHVRGEGRPFSLLADWRTLQGWEKGAKTLGTVMIKATGDMAKKVAVIADDRFADEQPRLADSFPGASVRFFPPAKAEQATAWLQGRECP